MSPRPIEDPHLTERGEERHPAFGLIGASRVSTSPPGASLFDSDIRHQHTVIVRVRAASRSRDLHRDWIRSEEQFVEVEMSEAQWASFVSSMNAGDGVPCTVRMREGQRDVPGLPYAPRLAQTMDEVRDAAEKAVHDVAEAFAAYTEKKTAANLRTLEARIRNLPANMEFSAKAVSEHTEAVVQKARADIEAMVITKAHQLGIEPGELGTLALPAGDPE